MSATPAPVTPALFDERLDRRGTNSMKWAGAPQFLTPDQVAANPLPLWVADMDFRAPQVVIDALQATVATGVYGYPAGATDSYLAAVTGWQRRRFGWAVDPAWVVPISGVITTLKTVVQAFTEPGESVLIQPPVYAHFHDDIRLNGRHLAYAPLERTETGYRFNADTFEAAIRPDTRLFILSHPHNPTGNVWSEDALRTMGEICARHDVLVVSDEIHQDLIMHPAKRHIPFASLGEAYAQQSITCTSPSKTFNLPGLQCANAIVPNRRLREALLRQYDRNAFPVVNLLGMVAAEAAYTHGEPWLEALLAYLRGNHAHFAAAIHAQLPQLRVLPAESLYLAWMDCRALGVDAATLHHVLLTQGRVWLDTGTKYGAEGHGYLRVNLGCPRATVDEAVQRIVAGVRALGGTAYADSAHAAPGAIPG